MLALTMCYNFTKDLNFGCYNTSLYSIIKINHDIFVYFDKDKSRFCYTNLCFKMYHISTKM